MNIVVAVAYIFTFMTSEELEIKRRNISAITRVLVKTSTREKTYLIISYIYPVVRS